MRLRNVLVRLLVAATLAAGVSHPEEVLAGAWYQWNHANGGAWDTWSYWTHTQGSNDPGNHPDANYDYADLTKNLGGTVTVSMDGNYKVLGLYIGGGTGTVYYGAGPGPGAGSTSYQITDGGGKLILQAYDAGEDDNQYGPGVVCIQVARSGNDAIAAPITVRTANTTGFVVDQQNTTNPFTISGAIDGGGLPMTVQGDGDTILGGAVSNISSLTKMGYGTLTITGNSTYSGGTTINQGVIDVQNAGALGTGSVTVTNSAGTPLTSLLLDCPTGMTLSNRFFTGGTGNGNNSPTDCGLVRNIQGNNTLSGPITLEAGGRASYFKVDAGTLTLSGTILNVGYGDTRTLYLGGAATGYVTGVIADGDGALVVRKVDSGTWVLTGLNSYTAGTNIAAGILNINGDAALGGPTGTLKFSGNGTLQAGANNIVLGSSRPLVTNSGVVARVDTQTNSMTIAGTIGGNGSLSKTGNGTLTLTASNTYTGGTTIQAGTLVASANEALGSGAVVVQGNPGDTFLNLSGTNLNFNQPLALHGNSNNNGRARLQNVSGTNMWSGNIDITSSGDNPLIESNGGFLTISGNIAGALSNGSGLMVRGNGSGAITGNVNYTGGIFLKTDLSTWTISSNGNSWGDTGVACGTLRLGAVNALPVTTVVTVGEPDTFPNGKLVLGNGTTGFNQTVAGLAISGPGTDNRIVGGGSNVATLTVNNTSNYSFGGFLGGSGQYENNLALVKSGSGTLTLTASNTYSGGTTITGSTLVASANGALGSGAVVVQGNPGDTYLNLSGNNLNFGQPLALHGNTNGSGRAALQNVSGTNTWSGNIDITSGDNPPMIMSNGGFLTISGNITGALYNGSGLMIRGSASGAITGNINYTGGILLKSDTGTWTISSAGNSWGDTVMMGRLRVGATNALPVTTVITLSEPAGYSAKLVLGDGTAGYNQTVGGLATSNDGTDNRIVGGGSNVATLTVNNTSNYSFGGFLGGSGQYENNLALVKSGSGMLTLSVSNTYTGGTTISGGTLNINADAALGTAPVAPTQNITFSGNGTLQAGAATMLLAANRSILINSGVNATIDSQGNAMTIPGTIGGSGSLTKAGNGTLTLTGSDTYTGVTTVSGGTLQIGTGGTTGNIAGDVTNNSILAFNRSNDFSYTGVISGSGTLIKSGTGILTLGKSNNYTGATIISGGHSKAATLTDGGVPSSIGQSSSDAANLVLDSGALGYSGTGDTTNRLFTITPASGAIYANGAGPIKFTNTGSIAFTGTGNRYLTLEATNIGDNTFAPMLADSGGYLFNLYKEGPGTWLLTGTNTYTNYTQIFKGVLSVSVMANGGLPSNIGASGSGAGNLLFTGGTLRYTGASASTDHLFSVGTAGGGLDASGAGPLIFTNTGNMGFYGQTGTRTLTLSGSNTDNNSLALTIGDNSGATSVVKTGSGKWTLGASNTFTGTTTVNGGTLNVAGSLACNGSDKVFIAANGTSFGANLTRAVASGNNAYAGLGSAITSDLHSATQLLYGVSTGTHNLSMQWRERTDAEKTASIVSDVLNLGGMTNSGSQTDLFVLLMQYDSSHFVGGSEATAAAAGFIHLESLDGTLWKNAVDLNIGINNPTFMGVEAWNGDTALGHYGVDTSTHTAWAVLDHNSQFAVMPEPTTFALLGVGAVSLLACAWRRWRRPA